MSTLIESDRFRRALGQFPTGVAIITTVKPGGQPVGLTVNSLASVSLEPPMVLWSLQSTSPNLSTFIEAGGFAVSVLTQAQRHLSSRFANRHVVDKFEGVSLQTTRRGLPILSESAAYFECDLHQHTTVGDHELFLGRVTHFDHAPRHAPLLFVRGNYSAIGDEG